MSDPVKEDKYSDIYLENNRYKKYMCYNCVFYKEERCIKNRIQRVCAKKGLKNKDSA